MVVVSDATDPRARALKRMLTGEHVVDITAMFKAGWTISAISRHTGRDRKTTRRVIAGVAVGRARQPSVLEPYRAYIAARLEIATGDPHLDASVLLRELRELGFERSYATLTRELRRLARRRPPTSPPRGSDGQASKSQ